MANKVLVLNPLASLRLLDRLRDEDWEWTRVHYSSNVDPNQAFLVDPDTVVYENLITGEATKPFKEQDGD